MRGFIGLLMLGTAAVIAGCAGPNGPPKGPVYYVTGDVVKVAYGQMDAQVACETVAETGSNIKNDYCYTKEEVVRRHELDRRETRKFGRMRCPDPALCVQ